MTRYVDIFTRRQIVALTSFSDLVSLARDRVLADALAANVGKDDTPLHLGGRGSTAYADAVVTYLGLALGRLADLGSSIASWIADLGAIRNTFARQAIPMVWDFAECNPITDKWEGAVEWIVRCLAFMPTTRGGTIVNAVAQDNDYLIVPSLISTDPPYYDNIGYAALSDFFYIWLRRSLSGVWPDLFRRLTTPKAEELVATPYRHGGKEAAEEFFLRGMSKALVAMRRAASDGEPLRVCPRTSCGIA